MFVVANRPKGAIRCGKGSWFYRPPALVQVLAKPTSCLTCIFPSRSKYLAGIENAFGIKRGLECPHEFDFGLAAADRKPGLLFQSDAMLGRDRAAKRLQAAINHRFDLGPCGKIVVRRNLNDHVKIAVAEMPKNPKLMIADRAIESGAQIAGESLHLRDGQ